MINVKAAQYSGKWFIIIFFLVAVFGLISWSFQASFNGFVVHYCSILLQYCGLDARILIKEFLYLWFGYGFLPTTMLLVFLYIQAREKEMGKPLPLSVWFTASLGLSIVLQSFIAYQMWGIRYLVADLALPHAISSNVPFTDFMFGFAVISLISIGVISHIIVGISSGLLKKKNITV